MELNLQRLHEAALEGNRESLLKLHEEDSLLVRRVTVTRFNETPLHVAALLGHEDFVKEILRLNPKLAQALDSQLSSPLHLASAEGHVEIVKALVSAKPEMCEALDRHGLNPLHLAAIKGRLEVLRELVPASPAAARARVDQVETILHLCVKNCQIEALKHLMEMETMEDEGLVNAKDEYGNTILHLAVAYKQIKTVKYLLNSGKVDVNATNANENTALDILAQSRRDVLDWDIGNSLQEAGALKAANIGNVSPRPSGMPSVVHSQSTPLPLEGSNSLSHIVVHGQSTPLPTQGSKHGQSTPLPTQGSNSPSRIVVHEQPPPLPENGSNPQMPSFLRSNAKQLAAQGGNSQNNLNQGEWLAKKRDALMVVASLLATMAFQAGVSPPGGVWQDDSPGHHRAGEAVIAYNYQETYKFYLWANTIGFVASLSIILLLISGLPFKRKIFMWILTVIMWLSITSMAFTYAFSIVAVTPKGDRKALRRAMYVAVPVWCGVMTLLLLGHTFRLTEKWLKAKGKRMRITI